MDFGVGLMGYHGCWDDAAFAEDHGFSSAGFVDSPLLVAIILVAVFLVRGPATASRDVDHCPAHDE